VEWVETTGSTTEAAKDAALDQLGVDEQDAEFEVLEEAKSGLFGLTRREARVRARVRPTSPRPKVERRDRRRKQGSGGRSDGSTSRSKSARKPGGDTDTAPAAEGAEDAEGTAASSGGPSTEERAAKPRTRRKASTGRSDAIKSKPAPAVGAESGEGSPMTSDDVTVEEQAEIITEFLSGLVDAYGLEGEVSQDKVDEDTIEVQVDGDDLGLLIGPKGQTLSAIQELSRTVVQRRATGVHHGRVRLDVSGYRQRRREALARFAEQVAADVVASGMQKALEPMNAADRKVVHDTVNEIDGVRTVSEGEDQRRRVVILPDD